MKKYLNEDGLLYLVQKIKSWLSGKVDKVDGKGLSTNDYTTTEKNKLANIAAGANKTTVENSLTSTSTTNALSAAQGKVLDEKIKAINTNMEDLGAGDMLKSVYDTNNNGKVDDAEKLGGQLPSYYAKASDLQGVDMIATQANSRVQNLSQEMQYFGECLGDMESLGTTSDNIVGAINEVKGAIPTNNNQLTNGAGYIKGISKNDVTTALGFTPYNSTNPSGYQTAAQVKASIEAVIGAAPDALNTLDELAAALGDDANFAATVTEELSKKVNSADLVAITNAEIDTIVAAN